MCSSDLSLYAISSAMDKMPSQEQLEQLSEIIEVPVETIADRLARTNSDFVFLNGR